MIIDHKQHNISFSQCESNCIIIVCVLFLQVNHTSQKTLATVQVKARDGCNDCNE